MQVEKQCHYFEQLAQEFGKVEGISLSMDEKEQNIYKDALAFLVDAYVQQFPDGCDLMLTDTIKKVKDFLKSSGGKEVRKYLEQQISTLYEAELGKKISSCPQAEKPKWEQQLRFHIASHDANGKKNDAQQIVFGSIHRELLPDWYKKKYLNL